MNIIKLDDLRKKIINLPPRLIAYEGGRVTLNSNAAHLMKAEAGDYLHFYTGDDGEIWIKVDKDPTHGLRFQTNKKNECTGYSIKLQPYLAPSGETTRYEVESDDFGKYKLVKI